VKTRLAHIACLASFVVGCGATALAAAGKEKPRMTLIATSEITFDDMFPGNPAGPKIVTVSGDRQNGAHISIVKFPPGSVSPLHTHSNEAEGVVVSGVMSHWHEGETQASAKALPAGSYFKEPAMLRHVTACAAGSECVAVIIQKSKWDGKPVEQPKTAPR